MSAGVSARKRDGVTPLFGKNPSLRPDAAARKNTRKAMMPKTIAHLFLVLAMKMDLKSLPDAFVRMTIGTTKARVPKS